LNTRSDEGEHQEYFFTSSKTFISNKAKLEKLSHPTKNCGFGSEPHFQASGTSAQSSS
jgi:hypothetical protein